MRHRQVPELLIHNSVEHLRALDAMLQAPGVPSPEVLQLQELQDALCDLVLTVDAVSVSRSGSLATTFLRRPSEPRHGRRRVKRRRGPRLRCRAATSDVRADASDTWRCDAEEGAGVTTWRSAPGLPSHREPAAENVIEPVGSSHDQQVAQLRRQLEALTGGGKHLRTLPALPSSQLLSERELAGPASSLRDFWSACAPDEIEKPAAARVFNSEQRIPVPPDAYTDVAPWLMSIDESAGAKQSLPAQGMSSAGPSDVLTGALKPPTALAHIPGETWTRLRDEDDDNLELCDHYSFSKRADGTLLWVPA